MKQTIVIKILLLLVGLQAGYLIGEYLDYRYGPTPMVTPSELVAILEDQ